MTSRPFAARHPGVCHDCGHRFDVGDQIGYDDTDTIVCVDCLRGDVGLNPSETVCVACMTVHRGECL